MQVVFEWPGLAGGCNWFVSPCLFIPLIIRFAFPFLPLDPAVTMGTVFTVAFHWLLAKLLSPFPPVSFPFSSLDRELWLSEDGEACKASNNWNEGSGWREELRKYGKTMRDEVILLMWSLAWSFLCPAAMKGSPGHLLPTSLLAHPKGLSCFGSTVVSGGLGSQHQGGTYCALCYS